jgi:Tol biopolymer transport system component
VRVIVGIAMGAAALLLSSATVSQAAWPGHNGKVAFTRNGDLWLMHPDGSSQHRIARNASEARWSPNGKRITFERGGNVWVMNADGSGQLQVTTATSFENTPSFSPDGRWILFQSDREHPGAGDYGIYKLRSTRPFGSVVTVIPSRDFQDSLRPVYAANGRFSYLWDEDNTSSFNCCDIQVIEGGVESNLAFTEAIGKIDWGPHSSTLAYGYGVIDPNIDDYGSSQIHLINADGTGHRVLGRAGTLDGYFDENPSWAPAGTWMVFDEYHQTDTGTTSGIWKMRGDGTGRVRIAWNGSEPDWQPVP